MKMESELRTTINNIILFLITTLVFFGYIFTNLYFLQMLLIIFALIGISTKGSILLKANYLWIIFLYLIFITMFFSDEIINSLKFIFMFFGVLITKIYMEDEVDWQNKFINLMLIGSSVHVLATLLQFVSPNIIENINILILSEPAMQINLQLLNVNSYAGITNQTGINSFYISIYIAVMVSMLVSKKAKKTILLFLIGIGILALLLTVKRSQIIINLISFLFVLVIFKNKDIKTNLFYVSLPIIIGLIGYFFISKIPGAGEFINKFTTLSSESDLTNGRDALWRGTLKLFYENPVLGIGINNVQIHFEDMTHNIYIQLMAETGILGFMTFVILVFGTFIFSVLLIYKSKDDAIFEKNKPILVFGIYMQLYFLLYGFFGNPLYGVVFFTMYAQSVAIIFSYKKISSQAT